MDMLFQLWYTGPRARGRKTAGRQRDAGERERSRMIRREGEGDRASEAAREVRLDRHALEPSQSQRFEGQRVFHGSGKRKQGG